MSPQPRSPRQAAPKKGAAARAAAAEKAAETREVAFREITITLPNELPGTMLFDLVELEAADANPMPLFRFLRDLLGQEQFNDVRAQITPEDNVVEVVDGLLRDIFGAYGLGLGE